MNTVKGLLVGTLIFSTLGSTAQTANAQGGKAQKFSSGFRVCADSSGEIRVRARCERGEREVSLQSLDNRYSFDGQLVTSSGITIESSESTVSIVAGESTITVDPEGVVSIKSNGDLTVEADQNLILKGQTITLDGNRIDINSATDTNIESGINTNIDSNVKSSVTSASLTEIKGAVVTIN